jgi:large subunit ribosomal protein L6
MSKVGKKPIIIPAGVKVEVAGGEVKVQGPNSNTMLSLLKGISVSVKEGKIIIMPLNAAKQTRSNWGTMRALIQNAVLGATADFTKELIIEGVGFRAEVQGKELVLNLGFSHPIRVAIPEGIRISVDKNVIKIAGADKKEVGDIAASIRDLKKPEPYKGKGIRYSDEIIRRKAGKKAVTSGGKVV